MQSIVSGRVDRPLHRGSTEVAYTFDHASHVGMFLRHHVGYDSYTI